MTHHKLEADEVLGKIALVLPNVEIRLVHQLGGEDALGALLSGKQKMTKVVAAMAVSLDGIADPEAPDGVAPFTEILG